jgi:hypothetical protein
MASVEEMENAARLEVESQHYFKSIFDKKRKIQQMILFLI